MIAMRIHPKEEEEEWEQVLVQVAVVMVLEKEEPISMEEDTGVVNQQEQGIMKILIRRIRLMIMAIMVMLIGVGLGHGVQINAVRSINHDPCRRVHCHRRKD